MNATWEQIQTLADQYAKEFETTTRDDGTTYTRRREDCRAEDALQALCFKAHGEYLPDDYRYDYIWGALNAITMTDDEDEAHESVEQDVTALTHDLTAWLHSDVRRVWYLSETIDEFGGGLDGFQLLAVAQGTERREVLASVLESLRETVEDAD